MMDTVTYFRHMERVIYGTAAIPVYASDYHHCDREVKVKLDCDSFGTSCPYCRVGFRVPIKKHAPPIKAYDCPCCGKSVIIKHLTMPKVA